MELIGGFLVISKIFYYLRVLSFSLYLIMCSMMLGYVFQCGFVGIFFLVCVVLYTGVILFTHLSKRKYFETTISYNFSIIFLTVYFCVIHGRVLFDRFDPNYVYVLNVRYLEVNFLLLSLIMLGIIFNTFLLYQYDRDITIGELFHKT